MSSERLREAVGVVFVEMCVRFHNACRSMDEQSVTTISNFLKDFEKQFPAEVQARENCRAN